MGMQDIIYEHMMKGEKYYPESKPQTTEAAQGYLDQWQDGYDKSSDYYDQIINTITKNQGERYDVIAGQIQDLKNQYSGLFGGLPEQFKEAAQTELGLRQNALTGLAESATPDYAGVRGQAMQDVAAQYYSAKEGRDRALLELGKDPTSMGAPDSQGMIGLALAKVQAANQAKMMEQQRTDEARWKITQTANPTGMTGAAQNIIGSEMDFSKMLADIENAKTGTQQGNLGLQSGAAGGMGNLIQQPLDISGLYTGLQYGQTKSVPSTTSGAQETVPKVSANNPMARTATTSVPKDAWGKPLYSNYDYRTGTTEGLTNPYNSGGATG